MATLAGVLVVVAYNMSEWRSFVSIVRGPRYDVAILLTTFFLTVVVDLTIAIEMGMILAAFLFMRSMIQTSSAGLLGVNDEGPEAFDIVGLPKGVAVFEVSGPLFFGAAYKFQDAIRLIDRDPQVLIIRLRKVPLIDATGIRVIREVVGQSKRRGIKLILTEIQHGQIMKDLTNARVIFAVGKANITDTLQEAIERSEVILTDDLIAG
jgi:SulP family sulfate permease